MDLHIDRTSSKPIYRQIVERIRAMIRSGGLPAGFQLPPERRLAEALGVNRSTVLAAYRELKAEGLLDAHVGRGTVVSSSLHAVPGAEISSAPLPWRQLLHRGGAGHGDPLIRDLLSLTERSEVISLAAGLPAPDLIPVEELGVLIDELMVEVGAPLFSYGPTEGHSALRATIAQWIAGRGIRCDPAEVLILAGSQQGLDLAARLLLEAGDVVVVEEPSFVGALEVFRRAGARLVGVPVDEHGMDTDVLQAVLERHRPRLIYTLPTFQNPSGTVMSLGRRHRLLELAARHQVPILEDDPYAELRYEGEPLPSLKALDTHDLVLYLSTFSKVLVPGLRLGFLVAPRTAVRSFALAKQAVDLHANSFGQWLLERFISRGHLDRHLMRLRGAYRGRRDAMAAALEATDADLQWELPRGGFYFWCGLPCGVDRSQLVASAAHKAVAFLPGWTCAPAEEAAARVRLAFSFVPVEQIAEGIARLVEAVHESVASGSATGLALESTPTIV